MTWDNEPLYLHKGKSLSPLSAYYFLLDTLEMLFGWCWILKLTNQIAGNCHVLLRHIYFFCLGPFYPCRLLITIIEPLVGTWTNWGLVGTWTINIDLTAFLCCLKVDTLFFSIRWLIIIIEVFCYYPDKGIIIKINISKANNVNNFFLIWYLLFVYGISMQQNVLCGCFFSLISPFYQIFFH